MNLPDIEAVADRVHHAWIESKVKSGIFSRRSEFGEELMVPYSKLSESAKELDRNTVRAVYAAITGVQLSTDPSVYRVTALSTSSLNPSSLNQSDQS